MRQKFLSACLLLLAGFGVIGVANCGSTPGADLADMAEASGVIVLGQVTSLKARDEMDHVTVRVVDVVKGTLNLSEFRLVLTPRGLVGFDVALSKGDVGVFFLASAPTGDDAVATLTHPQSVALLTKGVFSVAD